MVFMIVTYYGKQFFKIQLGERTIAYNPIGKDSKEKGSRFGADIVLTSLRHADFNGADQCAYGERQPFVISGPGEYEVGGIFIKGFGTDTTYDIELPYADFGLSDAILESGLRFNLVINDNDGQMREGFMRVAPGIGERKDAASFPLIRFDHR